MRRFKIKFIILNVPSLFSAEFTCLQDKRIGKFTFFFKKILLTVFTNGGSRHTHTRNFYGDYVAPTQEEVLFT